MPGEMGIRPFVFTCKAITLPAAKYRFDNLVKRGFVHDYIIETLPYPPDISHLEGET